MSRGQKFKQEAEHLKQKSICPDCSPTFWSHAPPTGTSPQSSAAWPPWLTACRLGQTLPADKGPTVQRMTAMTTWRLGKTLPADKGINSTENDHSDQQLVDWGKYCLQTEESTGQRMSLSTACRLGETLPADKGVNSTENNQLDWQLLDWVRHYLQTKASTVTENDHLVWQLVDWGKHCLQTMGSMVQRMTALTDSL